MQNVRMGQGECGEACLAVAVIWLLGKKFWRGCGRGGAEAGAFALSEVSEPGVRSAFGEWRLLAFIRNHMKTLEHL